MKKTLLSFMVALVLAPAVQPATYYVAMTGNDSNAGTSTNSAYLTIQKAASLMKAGDTCYILSGTYRETVTPANSGTSSSPITFAAYPGAIPIVSGADVLSLSWSVYSGSIYQASTTTTSRQLFVDGVMMNEARWPNATVNQLLYAPRSVPQHVTVTPYQASNSLTDTSLPSSLSLAGAYMHFFPDEYGNSGYEALTRQITNWNSSTKTFSWSGGSVSNGASFYQTGSFYYVYGALSLLDIPTEWYLNTASGTLYLWAPDGASPATHVVEVKDRTSAFTLDNLSCVIVNGIYVFGAGISMANTTSCVVNNCNLIYVQHNTTADWAVSVPIANQVSGSGSMWENSTIIYSSQDGIRCTGQNEVVSNCVIQQVDYYPGTYYAGVTAYSGAIGTKIVNNTIWYSGRYCAGDSGTSIEIGNNDLGWGDLLTSDGGGTYEYTSAADSGGGTVICSNWVHNCWAGVYVDQNQNNYIIYRNVCYSNYIGILCNMFTNNLFINNTSVSNTTDIQFNGSSDVAVSNINNLWNSFTGAYGSTTVTDDGWYPPVGTNYVLLAGSAGIHGGEIYPPYAPGYNGLPPDVGAYQNGETWTPGAHFTAQPFPNTNSIPAITMQPASQTNVVGQTATFSVTANSVLPLYYQWRVGAANGGGSYTNLVAGGQFSAVTNATLNISNLVASNALAYVVVVSNSNGAVTSAVATLSVLNDAPSITMQPASQTNTIGQTATFTVTATGLPPLYYQWQAGAANGGGPYSNLVAGGQFSAVTNATLTIPNLVASNAAAYVVVVSNSSSSITSAVATLTVLTVSPYQVMVLADNPVSYWPMQETTGPTIHDIVGGYDGTLMTSTDGTSLGNNQHNAFANGGAVSTDGATYLLGGPGGQAGVPGDLAVYFTNLNTSVNNSQIVVPYNSALDPENDFTAEAWIYVPTYPIGYTKTAFQTALGLEAFGGAGNGWWMAFETDSSGTEGDVQFNLAEYPGQWLSPAPASTSSFAGQWVHVVEVYNGSNSNLLTYTNGALMATVAMSTYYESEGLYSLHKLPFIIGSYSSPGGSSGGYNGGGTLADGYERGNFWHGGISHVAIYNYALASSRILAHYQAGSTASSPAPPSLSILRSGTNVAVSWTNGFLQQAASVAGPWTELTNTVSPYTVGATNAATFFRATLLPPP